MTLRGGDAPSRRRLLLGLGGLGGTALAALLARDAAEASATGLASALGPHFAPKAKRAIWLFMAGGPSQLDLFDYKPGLAARFDQDLPQSVRNGQRITGMTSGQARLPIAPSLFPFAQAGASGAWISDRLPFTRKIVDDIAIVKTVHTEAINHEPGVIEINTGTSQPGKPAVGAWLSYGLGRESEDLPAFVVMTSRFFVKSFVQALSARLWSSGFLPAEHGAVPMRGSGEPVLYLSNPPGVDSAARRSMLDALSSMNQLSGAAVMDPSVAERTAQYESAFRLQSAVPGLVEMTGESESTFALYGEDARTPGTFAANCLLARRMLERGVRFVQIYHRGWDSHYELPKNHALQCLDVDRASYALITDLKQRGLLEDTLVIWGGEFGRTVYCQGALSQSDYGRDHHGRCFSMWLAGAGVRGGVVHGETDDFGYNIVSDAVPVRDLHATILERFGLDHERLVFSHQGLDEKLVGVGTPARPVKEILG